MEIPPGKIFSQISVSLTEFFKTLFKRENIDIILNLIWLKKFPFNLLNGSSTNDCIISQVLTASKNFQFVQRQKVKFYQN